MYGNRSMGGYSNQQGLMGSTNMMMGNQMAGMANMQLLGQVGGQRDLRGSGSLFPMNASPGMQPGGFNINSRMNMTPQAQDAVLDILPRRSAAGGMQRGGSFDRRGRAALSFSPPQKRSRPGDDDNDDIDADDRRSAKGRFKCQVCRLQFASIDDFDDHMGSEGHAANMKVMSAIYYDKNQQLLSTPFETQRRKTSDKSGLCPVCDRAYGAMSESQHMQSKQHKHRQYLVTKGCMLCGVNGFDNYTAYVTHIDSPDHKQKKRELTKATEGATSSSMKSNDVKSSVKKPATKKETEVEQKAPVSVKRNDADDLPTQSETASPPSDIAESSMFDADDLLDDLVYNPDIAIGVEHVISVTGYFCKLCHKFYNNETMARITHCKSQAHFDKYLDYQHQKQVKAASLSSTVHEATTTNRNAESQFTSPRGQ